LAVITVFIPRIVSNIHPHIKEIKQLNEHMFENPPTQAPNKEGLAHPMPEAQGLLQARLVKIKGTSNLTIQIDSLLRSSLPAAAKPATNT
jgi:hypothetical protein